MTRRVAILGAGFLGLPLARALAPAWTVRATSRSGAGDGAPIEGVRLGALDLVVDPPERIAAIVGDVEALVLCFAAGRDQDRRALYVDGAARALAAAGPALERVIFTSSTSALPDLDGVVDESCAIWPAHDRGHVMREAEEAVRAGAEGRGAAAWILRLGGLYGPGRGLGRLYRGAPGAILEGDGMQATNLIHRDDALAAIVAALESPVERAGVVHVCDDDHRPRREMFARIAAIMGWPDPRWSEAPRGPGVRGKIVDNARMKAILGVTLAHPEHVLEDS